MMSIGPIVSTMITSSDLPTKIFLYFYRPSIAILNATHLNNLNFRVRLSHLEIL